MKTNNNKIYLYCFILFLFSIFLDQFTKYLAETNLINNSIDIIKGVFSLTYLQNRGVGFGLFQNKMLFIILTNVIVIGLIVIIFIGLPKIKRTIPLHVLLTLIVSGAIGNIIDRVRLGYVIDFLYFELIDFPIFNVADIFVTVSVILLMILLLFVYSDKELNEYMSFKSKNKSMTKGDEADE